MSAIHAWHLFVFTLNSNLQIHWPSQARQPEQSGVSLPPAARGVNAVKQTKRSEAEGSMANQKGETA